MPPKMDNQMEKKTEHEMETGIIEVKDFFRTPLLRPSL